jgi:hypothetical protein
MIAALGGLAYALTANILVLSGTLQPDQVSTSFGVEMTSKAVMIWIVCVLLAITGSFMIASKWRYILVLSPIYAPSLFALIYTLINKTPV